MALRKLAIIAVEQPAEVQSFYSWVARNRAEILAISNNEGCGCCVDIFHIEIGERAEPMPCECEGDFDASALRFGEAKEEILNLNLDYRLGEAGPDTPNDASTARPEESEPPSPSLRRSISHAIQLRLIAP